MAISQRTRVQILDRDGHRCRFCGATAQQERLEVDHIRPRADGGTDALSNLATLCRRCNGGKSDLWFGDYMAEQVEREITPPERRSALYPEIDYQRRALEGLLISMEWENVQKFSAFDLAMVIATTPRDGVQPFFEPLTAATCREAIDEAIATGRLRYSAENDQFTLVPRPQEQQSYVADDYDPLTFGPDDYHRFDPNL